jgi:hypothetical protein
VLRRRIGVESGPRERVSDADIPVEVRERRHA